MEYVQLGTSDLQVSRICVGCMGLGDPALGMNSWAVTGHDAEAVIRHALELGINFFDTAMSYQEGDSERVLGASLRKLARREDYVVATKFLPRSQAEIDAGVDGREHVARCLDASLERLGLDHVDLYIYHMWDYHTPMDEILEGLGDVVSAGKARIVGASNCFAWQLAKADAYARASGLPRFVSYQGHYNLIAREDERETLPFARDAGIALTPYSPLASGRLSHPLGESTARREQDGYAKFKYDKSAAADAAVIRRVEGLADRRGVSMAEVSLSWLLGRVAAPIVGATRPSHLDGAASAVGLSLSADEVAYLEEPYVPHELAGVMAQNGTQAAGDVV